MSEKVIEETCQYVIPEPKTLFKEFCSKVKSATLPDSWAGKDKEWTNVILNIFDEIGRRYHYKPKREYLRLDQTWEIRLLNLSYMVLALEHENTRHIEDLLDDELQKLSDVKASLKVLVYYPRLLDIERHIKEIKTKLGLQKIKISDERLLVIMLSYFGIYDNEGGKEERLVIHGYGFDVNGKSSKIGYEEVEYASKN